MRRYTTEFWVGLFTLMSLLVALYMVFRTGDLRLERQPGYDVLVDFSDVAGLDVGDSVRVAGVEVGKVESISLEENLGALQALRAATDKPIWFKPNAGLPELDAQGAPVYSVTPAEMGARVPDWISAGAQIVGGCCGTSPAHLAAIAQAVKKD